MACFLKGHLPALNTRTQIVRHHSSHLGASHHNHVPFFFFLLHSTCTALCQFLSVVPTRLSSAAMVRSTWVSSSTMPSR